MKEFARGVLARLSSPLVAGFIAEPLVPSSNHAGLVITCAIGIAGALLGDFIPLRAFRIVGIRGFCNASAWITAIAGWGLRPGAR